MQTVPVGKALSTLGEMTLAIGRATTLESIFAEALAAVSRATGAPRASVLLFDDDGVMRFKAWLGLSDAYRQAVEGHTPWTPGQRDSAPVLIERVDREASLTRFLPVIEAEGIGAMAMVPLVANGGVIGKFMVYHAAAHQFSSDELAVAGIVAAHTAFALERQRAQRALEAVEARLWEKQRQESLVTMASGIAHDFNNLLMVVLGNAKVALETVPRDSPAHAPLEDAVTGAWRAAELTQQLLAYAGKASFVGGQLDLSAVVRDSAALLSSVISHQAQLTLDCPEGLPPVQGDATQLRQVAMNLLTNACDALGGRPGTIRLSTHRCEAHPALLERAVLGHSLKGESFVCLQVTDSGSGMDEVTRRRIFDPFFTTKFQGRGLGLAAVLGIVHAHGGAIVVESAPGAGTTIEVLLPAALPAPAPARPSTPRPPVPSGQGSTVLIVDDEQLMRSACGRILTQGGYQVLLAENGLEALEVLQARRGEVAAVLLDLTMPGLSGEQTLERIHERWPGLPVVLTSGYTVGEAARARWGETRFLQKPYLPAALREAVAAALTSA